MNPKKSNHPNCAKCAIVKMLQSSNADLQKKIELLKQQATVRQRIKILEPVTMGDSKTFFQISPFGLN
jgi:hypothetical protein